uniref:Uncharacterized protein n=1 Tax=Globisporangium ultimum (strain ATCC 200006 / CBS 805.95 / DAOM BR144) TaxID=431595 RepID=K3WU14_GLOUD
MAVLCKCHPLQSSKLLSRILAYVSIRLRDNESKVTEACRTLVSSVVLHIVPVHSVPTNTTDDSTSGDAKGIQVHGDDIWLQVFETVAAPLLKDSNAVGENATKCLCSVVQPTEFDGHTLPSDEILLAHATRVHSFFKSILSASVAKMNGSTMYASFSPVFLLLQSACQLAHEVNSRCGFKELFVCIVPYAGFIFEAIEDVFQYAPREDWVLRKRGIELLTMLLEYFALSDDAIAESTKESVFETLSYVGGMIQYLQSAKLLFRRS